MNDEDDIPPAEPQDDALPAKKKYKKYKLSAKDLEAADAVLKAQIALMRIKGNTFKEVSQKFGYDERDLGEHFRRWIKEALDLDPDAGQYILDLSLTRYEALVKKLWDAVAGEKADVLSQGYARAARLLLDVMNAECRLVGAGGRTLDDEGSPFPTDAEAEAERLGLITGGKT